MKSSTASLLALIIAPLLALATPVALSPAPSKPLVSLSPANPNTNPSIRPPPPDFSKIPTYHDDMLAIQAVLNQYADAVNRQDVSQFDKIFAPGAQVWNPKVGSLNGIPAIKSAVTNLKPDPDCVYTRAFNIETVWTYSATAAADTQISGTYDHSANCTTSLHGLYNTYGFSTQFGDWLTLRNSPHGERIWQYTSHTSGADWL